MDCGTARCHRALPLTRIYRHKLRAQHPRNILTVTGQRRVVGMASAH
jgi:hypothetical protein